MRNPPTTDVRPEAPNTADEQGIHKLRELLLRPEQEHLADLEARMLNPDRLAVHVGRALPLAVRRGHKEGDHLSGALAPIIESAIEKSIRRNPKLLAEILFPVIGRAVRHAVADAWQSLIQTLNQALETRLSPRGLKLRWIAWRTGQPYAELVLANMLVYQVEQIFLIHKETGLLLEHKGQGGETYDSGEVVSSMLTAIQDFVQDSFAVEEDTPLGAMQVGDLQVWVEPGPNAYLAAVIRGHPTSELRQILKSAVEEIEFEFSRELTTFQGDTTPFEGANPILTGCLLRKKREPKKGPMKVGFTLIVLLLVSWFAWLIYGNWRQNKDVDWIRQRLAETPGYWLAEARYADGGYRLLGMRDPLAPELVEALAGSDLAHPYQGFFQQFHSLEPAMLLARSRRLLVPPPTVKLAFHDQVLVATGSAPQDWISKAEINLALMPEIAQWDLTGLQVPAPPPDPAIALKQELEAWQLPFAVDQIDLQIAQQAQVDTLLPTIAEFLKVSEERPVYLEVGGHSDASGRETYNLKISTQRARSVTEYLVAKGLPREKLRAVGFGSASIAQGGARLVTLSVREIDSP